MNTGPLHFVRLYTTRSRAIGRGQNLADRYVRLENALREKQALRTNIDSLRDESIHQQETQAAAPKKGNTFRGLIVPEKPAEPASDECCMSGCAICVYDLYEESLDAYKEKVTALRNQLTTMAVPATEWPESIRGEEKKPAKSPMLNALEELERKIAEKQKQSASS
ncbi:hypothetical protein CYLTODRAFT_344983 [Cylindrobasidium torrendii FP15055 ss-10]|uniref:Oxidoreductase-like domain-containing protein n=1 Tax=Cylindrobasidium torrendii FP15055 ss-10 TaxID=1314674 RepID=A0A0D7BP17_9AGAR|nr:hypothetical protein CYLTODRAFT_344983 [Cylindrobasidium torrendii FP15055 ss-10]